MKRQDASEETLEEITSHRRIGSRISEIRRLLRLSQASFAEELGISRARLANFESGRSALPCELALRLCSHFVVNEVWLATGHGNPRDCLCLYATGERQAKQREAFRDAFVFRLDSTALRSRLANQSVVSRVMVLVADAKRDERRNKHVLAYMLDYFSWVAGSSAAGREAMENIYVYLLIELIGVAEGLSGNRSQVRNPQSALVNSIKRLFVARASELNIDLSATIFGKPEVDPLWERTRGR